MENVCNHEDNEHNTMDSVLVTVQIRTGIHFFIYSRAKKAIKAPPTHHFSMTLARSVDRDLRRQCTVIASCWCTPHGGLLPRWTWELNIMDLGHFIWHMRVTKIYRHKTFCAHAAIFKGLQRTRRKTQTSHLVRLVFFSCFDY